MVKLKKQDILNALHRSKKIRTAALALGVQDYTLRRQAQALGIVVRDELNKDQRTISGDVLIMLDKGICYSRGEDGTTRNPKRVEIKNGATYQSPMPDL